MKKFFWVLVLLLISDVSYASDHIPNSVFYVVFCISAAIGIVVSAFAFVASLMVAIPVFVASSAYYTGKNMIESDSIENFYETELCQAAKDLSIDFNDRTLPSAYYSTKSKNDSYFNKVEELDPLFLSQYKMNKEANYLCIGDKGYCSQELFGNYTKAEGVWKPIKAFSYNGKSYIQLKQTINDKEYITATANFNYVFKYFDYDGFNVFRTVGYGLDVKDLCPILRRVSIHRLKGLKEVI